MSRTRKENRKEFAVFLQDESLKELPKYTTLTDALQQFIDLGSNSDVYVVQRVELTLALGVDSQKSVFVREKREIFPNILYEGVVTFERGKDGYHIKRFADYNEAFNHNMKILSSKNRVPVARVVSLEGVFIRDSEWGKNERK